MRNRHGFTLLEVMVAVAILGIALASIFSSEAGAIHVGARARMMTTATLLARCKMGEIEEQIAKEGLPAVFANGTDHCCEEGEVEGFECDWEIERVVLPDQGSAGEDAQAGADDATGTNSLGDPLEGVPLTGESVPTSLMSGAMLGGGNDMVAQMALQYAFPVIKPQLEEQVRRATVKIRWREGDGESSFEVVQYLVAEQAPAILTQNAAQQAMGQQPGQPSTNAPAPSTNTQAPPGQAR